MKKFCLKTTIFIILCAIVFPICSAMISLNKPDQVSYSLDNLSVSSSKTEITSIEGDFIGSLVKNEQDAFNVLDQYKDSFGIENARASFRFNKVVESLTGSVYIFDQIIDGRKVYGGEINLATETNFRVSSINGKFKIGYEYDRLIAISESQAVESIKNEYKDASIERLEDQIYISFGQAFITYVYKVVASNGTYEVYVSARTGKIVCADGLNSSARQELPTEADGYTISQVETTQSDFNGNIVSVNVDKYLNNSTQSYYFVLADKEKNIYMTDGKGQTGNTAYTNSTYYISTYPSGSFVAEGEAISAFVNLNKCYDFYADSSSFGKSIIGMKDENGNQIKLIAIVNYGVNYANAGFAQGSNQTGYFIFGNGDGRTSTSFAVGLDIVAHEYQHAITTNIKDLKYSGESGGLNEAYSDMFGAVIEGKGISSSDFWRMGEDIVIEDGQFYRDLSNPKNPYAVTNQSLYCVDNYSEALELISDLGTQDNGGVHYTSTLMPYATYLMYKNNPEFFTETVILKLWYQTLSKYLTTTSTFKDFCAGMIKSAQDLGFNEAIDDIKLAFSSVGVPGYETVKIWNNYNLTMLQGQGTIASPYLINSVQELASAAYYINNGIGEYGSARYRVTTDLDLKNVKWEPIGTVSNPFNGYFNGGQKTISGLNISASGGEFSGLFGYVETDGYIYDVFVGEGNVTSQATYTGAIVGYNKGSMSGCSSKLNITGRYVGGLAGITLSNIEEDKISTSFVDADLSGDVVGGLTAVFNTYTNENYSYLVSSYISSCYAEGNFTGNIVGGLVGQANAVYVANNIVVATLNPKSNNATLGGAVGELYFRNFISGAPTCQNVNNFILAVKSVAEFNVSSNLTKVGLLVGNIDGDASQGKLYLDKNVLKERIYNETCFNVYNSETNDFILDKNTKLSIDDLYSGDFAFDNEAYFNNTDNWVYLKNIEAFDIKSTFKVNSQAMLTFKNPQFWINDRTVSKLSGAGTAASPYKISTAQELAFFANKMSDKETYPYYYNKTYLLTEDINLEGRIWVGIGFTFTEVNEKTGVASSEIYPFVGTFIGNGKTISNIETLGLYSVNSTSVDGREYELSEYAPALFSCTAAIISGSTVKAPTISDLTIQKLSARGSNAAGVVSTAYLAVNLQNVTVMDSVISSPGFAGGLIGKIDGLSGETDATLFTSSISGCYVLAEISGRVAGGAVGYISNATKSDTSLVTITNFLFRGRVNVIGQDKENEYQSATGKYAYNKATGGAIVGVTLAKQLTIINSLVLGDVVSYSVGPHIGGFIGSIGVGNSFVPSLIYVTIDSCKFMGNSYYIYDDILSSDGSAIGAVHTLAGKSIVVTINEKTVTNQDAQEIKYQNSVGFTLNSDMKYSTDKEGEGEFDIYSSDYFKDSSKFNSSHIWTNEEISRIMFKVSFVDYDGTVLKEITGLKVGDSVTAPDVVPTRPSDDQYDYVFKGWSESFDNITKSMIIFAVYDEVLRKFQVQYLDNSGKVIAMVRHDYGSEVNQNVEPPEVKGSFFRQYTFVRWGLEGQQVKRDIKVRAYYTASLTKKGTAVIFITTIVVLGFAIFFATKRKIKN